jgi:hypothetical protein
MNQFRIYYDNGLTHDDDIETAPSFGVLVILQRRASDGRWFISSNAPYYAWCGKEWLHFYENDMVDYLVHNKPIQKLIVGRMVDKGEFQKAYEQAKADRQQHAMD